jgi:hypothetical protein
VAPGLIAGVLLSTGLTPAGSAVGRVGGFGLLCLAVACWPAGDGARTQPVRALFLYNLLAACYLGYVQFSGEFGGSILLLASALHGVLALFFARSAYDSVTSKDPG